MACHFNDFQPTSGIVHAAVLYEMSLLIEGPTGPKHNIDVYLQPLIDELNILWGQGILTWDASMKQYFWMRANLM